MTNVLVYELGPLLKGDPCDEDLNCTLRLICGGIRTFENVTDPISNNITEKRMSHCMCTSTNGFQGENCTELGTDGYFQMGIAIILQIFIILLFLISLHTMYVMQRRSSMKLSSANGIVVAFVAITSLLGLLSGCMPLTYYRDPTEMSVVTIATGTFKGDPDWIYTAVVTTGGLLFGYLSNVHLSLAWIEVAERASKMRSSSRNSGHLSKYRLVIYAVEFCFGILVAVCIITLQVALAALAAIPFAVFLIIMYVVGARMIVRVIQQSLAVTQTYSLSLKSAGKAAGDDDKHGSDSMKSAADSILFAARYLFFFLVVALTARLVAALLAFPRFGRQDDEFEGWGRWQAWLRYISFYAQVGAMYVQLHYVRSVVMRSAHKEQQRLAGQAMHGSADTTLNTSRLSPDSKSPHKNTALANAANAAGSANRQDDESSATGGGSSFEMKKATVVSDVEE